MSALDIAILVILAVALLLGFLHGLFRPLITWAFIIAGVAIGFGHPGVAARFAPSAGWRPVMGLVVVVVFAVVGFLVARLIAPRIYRLIPGMGALDRVGGMLLSGVLALVMIFILLSGLVTLDRATAPLDGNGTVSAAQINEVRQFVASNPAAGIALDPAELQSLENSLGSTSEPASQLAQANFVLGVLRNLHIQMAESKVAPIVFNAGERVPFLGDGRTWPAG
ncbi:MAG: CvpA family protein [Candidatus Dormibacteria bacterium]